MEIKIPEITIDIFRAWGDPALESAYYDQEMAVNAAWKAVYSAVFGGCQVLAYWDSDPAVRPGYRSFMRYALHKSPRRDGWLQLSVMEMRDGNIIPTSHAEFNRWEDFIIRIAPFDAVEVTFLEN